MRLVIIALFIMLGLWACDTTTGCLGDIQTQAGAERE